MGRKREEKKRRRRKKKEEEKFKKSKYGNLVRFVYGFVG